LLAFLEKGQRSFFEKINTIA
jgi:hypothetical protein